jgi:arylsulfatase A-like enzyme
MHDDRPSFLVFCTDQHSSACLGCNGHPMVRTPHSDVLAAEGVTFTRAYVNNPVCMPSRATLLTGKTPRQHGLLTNGCRLPESVPTLTGSLAAAGYRTHAVGKLHLQPFGGSGDAPEDPSREQAAAWNDGRITRLPQPYYGFQTAEFVGGHVDYVFGNYRRWLDAQHPGAWDQYQAARASRRVGGAWHLVVPAEWHYNTWIADRARAFLGSVGDARFFLWCSFPDPHFPFAATSPYAEMYDPADVTLPPTWQERDDPCDFLRAHRAAGPWRVPLDEAELRESTAQTYGMIAHVDASIGRVLAALHRHGLDRRTVVALVADHGEYLGTHGLLYKGHWPYEAVQRVPFVWRLPGGRGARGPSAVPVSLLDFVPTVADLAGLADGWHDTRGPGAQTRLELPGRSLRPLLEGGTLAPRPILFEYDEDVHAGVPPGRLRGVVWNDWKLALWAGFADGVLFNLREDPQERRNRWEDPGAAAVRSELLRVLAERLAATDRFDARRICGA